MVSIPTPNPVTIQTWIYEFRKPGGATSVLTSVITFSISTVSSSFTSSTSVNPVATPTISASGSEISTSSPLPTPAISTSESEISTGSLLLTQTSLSDTFLSQPSTSTDFRSKLIDEDHGGLSAGAEAGIALGVIAFVFFVAGGIFLIRNIPLGIRSKFGARSWQPEIADLNMGEIIREPKPKPKMKLKLKRYFSFAFLLNEGKARANSPLVGFELDGARSQRRLKMEGTAQRFDLECANSQRPHLDNTEAMQRNDGPRKAQRHDDMATITDGSAGTSHFLVPTPFESYSAQGQKLADSEEVARLEEEAKRIDEEIASAERLQQLRNERLIIQNRLREVRRGSSGS